MENLFEELKRAFAHQAIVEGLPIKAEHTNRLAEIAYRLCNEHIANFSVSGRSEQLACVHPYGDVYQSETECYCEKCGKDLTVAS